MTAPRWSVGKHGLILADGQCRGWPDGTEQRIVDLLNADDAGLILRLPEGCEGPWVVRSSFPSAPNGIIVLARPAPTSPVGWADPSSEPLGDVAAALDAARNGGQS